MPLSGTVEARSRAFYDGIAEDYDRLLGTELARGMRECFWQRVEAALPGPSRILDFGAGTGVDAEHFAQAGHHVTAYDVSAGMLEVLKRRCAAQVAAGTIVPISGTPDEAREALAAGAPYDAIVCNFAVFSVIPRLDETLRLFGRLVRPGGTVLICVQNPWWPQEMRTRSFWRALLMMPWLGVIRYSSSQSGYTFRHTPGQIRRAARPEFVPDRGPVPDCCGTHFGPRSGMRLVALCRS
jgi:ubiquinone/menaquinone biosynthesis C-methylase UbiE